MRGESCEDGGAEEMIERCKWLEGAMCSFKKKFGREPEVADCLLCMVIDAKDMCGTLVKIVGSVGAGEWADTFLRVMERYVFWKRQVLNVMTKEFPEFKEVLTEKGDVVVISGEELLRKMLEKLVNKDNGGIV